MSAIALEMAGCEMESCAAALPMLPHFATIIRILRSRKVRQWLNRRSSQAMADS